MKLGLNKVIEACFKVKIAFKRMIRHGLGFVKFLFTYLNPVKNHCFVNFWVLNSCTYFIANLLI